ncbi:MAG TPA: class I adenylate-forming enzyme family protein [Acidimicrobiales bacterium]|nr:class I adenylate-forming enzyme family protein [Acidimicrobiales bacterium]
MTTARALNAPPIDFARPLSIDLMLRRAVANAPGATALVGTSGRIDYRTLDEASNRAAHALARLGVRAGDRVAVSLPNDLPIVVAIMGIWKLGAVSVGVHRALARPEKEFFLDDSGASVLLADPGVAADIGANLSQRAGLRDILTVDEWQAQLEEADASPPGRLVDPLDLAAVAYTSGTTGLPKGVMHSQHNALLPGAVSVHRGSFGPDEPIAVVHPLTILNLMVLNPLTTLAALSTCVLCDRHDAPFLAGRIRDEKVACISVVPTIFYELLTSPEVSAADLATLTKPRTGGAAMAEEIKRLFTERFGVRPVTSYASTEAPTLVTRQDEDAAPVEGSCGPPLPHIELKILDDDDREVAVGEAGEVSFGPKREGEWAGVYRTMLGYWERPEETARTLRGGLVHSGDIGRIDEYGELHLLERRSQLIIRGGSNIYPAEVERVLRRDPRVVDCCVVGRPDERYGEVVVAFVEAAPESGLAVPDLLRLCEGNLARYKVPSEIRIVGQLPRGPLGKVSRADVKRLAQ